MKLLKNGALHITPAEASTIASRLKGAPTVGFIPEDPDAHKSQGDIPPGKDLFVVVADQLEAGGDVKVSTR